MVSTKRKICFVTTTSITLKTFVLDTAIMLHDRLNMDITFVCDEDESFSKTLPSFIHYYPISMKRGVDVTAIKSMGKLVNLFKKEKFDIVQYSTPNAALYASIAAKKARVPVRLYAQWGIRYVGFSGWKRTVFKLLEKITCTESTHIRAVSPMNLEFALCEGLYKKEKAKVIGNGGTIGVNLAEYPLDRKDEWREEIRKSVGIPRESYVFGFAGRLSKDKGGKELIGAVRNLLENNRNISLLVVGPDETDSSMEPELKKWAQRCESIYFTGLVPKKDMPKYYAAMDTLVHPTYREGFGMVLQEAGAMELSIITTKIPGASEVMEDGVSCILVEPQNMQELKHAMDMVLSDIEKTKLIGRAAYERTKRYYDRPIMLENQCADYRSIIEGKTGGNN